MVAVRQGQRGTPGAASYADGRGVREGTLEIGGPPKTHSRRAGNQDGKTKYTAVFPSEDETSG